MSDNGDASVDPMSRLAMNLGLGPQWRPAPFAWSFVPGQMGDQRATYVIFDHVGGKTGLVAPNDAWRKFIAHLEETMSGLTIAREVPPE